MDKTLRDYAARSAPRYTSYPTAPHFTDVIDSASYADWLRCVPDEVSFSLYAHIPFCRSICHYCGCHTKATRQEAPVRAYARTLLQEIDLVTGRIGQGRPLKHLHWGGGTPSLLPHDELKRIASKIYRYFDISPTIEHAIELDPRTVDLALADPPYDYDRWSDLLDVVDAALLVAESDRPLGPHPSWQPLRERTYGSTVVAVLQPVRSAQEAP